MTLRRQLEPALGKRCRTRRVGQCELLGRLEHGLYRYVVSWLRALGELERHLCRQGTSGDQHVGTLAIESPSDRDGQAGTDRLSDEVVTEGQAIPILDEDVRLKKFGHRVYELAHRQRRNGGEVVEREAETEARCECGNAAPDR